MPDERTLDLNKSVHELCGRYPELVQVMAELGFEDIAKPGMLATAGRFMTIPKGAAMKKLSLDEIVAKLREKGYTVEGGDANE